MRPVTLIATSTFGLEAVVKRELQDLGFCRFSVCDGKVECAADVRDIPRLNLWLRSADRVLLKLGEFPASDFDQLFDSTQSIPWEEWLPKNGKITVTGKSVRSQLASVRANQSIVKKAIVERLKKKFRIAWLPETGPEFIIQAALFKDTAQITLDTSGSGLHKRGYRTHTGEVPLRENLAAALVLLSSWTPDRFLIDPMCGSGTILIEAAMICRRMAPGLRREFASQGWPAIGRKAWDDARKSAEAALLPPGRSQICGYDLDPVRIKDARGNARRANVEQDIVFQQKDITQLHIDGPVGQVICNPPYGVKAGRSQDLGPIYAAMDRLFGAPKGWSVAALTADKSFPRHFQSRRPDKIRKLFNGTIEVNYYQYHGDPSKAQVHQPEIGP